MMAKLPGDRFQSARQVADALAPYVARSSSRPKAIASTANWTGSATEPSIDPNVARWRRRLLGIGPALVAIALLLVGMRTWTDPFPYRLWDRPATGVASRIDFLRVNAERTARARDRAIEQVSPVFNHNPRSVAYAPQELNVALLTFVMAKDVARLPVETRRAFGLSVEGNQPPAGSLPAGDRNEAFQKLKEIASHEQTLRDVVADFTRFLQPLEKTGLIRPEHITPELSGTGQLSVAESDGTLRTVNLAEVQLQPLLAPTGMLHSRWALFPSLLPIRSELESWLKVLSPETLVYDEKATQQARLKASKDQTAVLDFYNAGNLLVKPGEVIDEGLLALLKSEYDNVDARVTLAERLGRTAIVFVLFLVLAVLVGWYLRHNEPNLVWNLSRYARYLALIVMGVWLGRELSFDPWRGEIGVVLAVVLICAVVHNQVLAGVTALAMSLAVTMACGGGLERFVVMISVCTTAVILLFNYQTRSKLAVAGVWTALVCLLFSWGATVLSTDNPTLRWHDAGQWWHSLRSAAWCLVAGIFVSGIQPFINSWFGVPSDT
jgi:membrane-associated HD superfamily phosphohydrolase